MDKYLKEAKQFLKDTNTVLDIIFVRVGVMDFDTGDQFRDIYNFILTRGELQYSSEFGNSLDKSGRHRLNGDYRLGLSFETYPRGCPASRKTWRRAGCKPWNSENWVKNTSFKKPNAYDILSCISGATVFDDVDEFAAEYGYDRPSQALRIFEAVKAEHAGLRVLYNEDELERLNEIT